MHGSQGGKLSCDVTYLVGERIHIGIPKASAGSLLYSECVGAVDSMSVGDWVIVAADSAAHSAAG